MHTCMSCVFVCVCRVRVFVSGRAVDETSTTLPRLLHCKWFGATVVAAASFSRAAAGARSLSSSLLLSPSPSLNPPPPPPPPPSLLYLSCSRDAATHAGKPSRPLATKLLGKCRCIYATLKSGPPRYDKAPVKFTRELRVMHVPFV